QNSLPALRPQTLTSGEAVVSARLLGHLALEGAVHFQEIDDKIEFVQQATSFVATNRGRQQMLGGTLTARLLFQRFAPFVTTGADLTSSTDPSKPADETLTGFSLQPTTSFPLYYVYGGLNVEIPEVFLNANAYVRWVGPRGASQSNILANDST